MKKKSDVRVGDYLIASVTELMSDDMEKLSDGLPRKILRVGSIGEEDNLEVQLEGLESPWWFMEEEIYDASEIPGYVMVNGVKKRFEFIAKSDSHVITNIMVGIESSPDDFVLSDITHDLRPYPKLFLPAPSKASDMLTGYDLTQARRSRTAPAVPGIPLYTIEGTEMGVFHIVTVNKENYSISYRRLNETGIAWGLPGVPITDGMISERHIAPFSFTKEAAFELAMDCEKSKMDILSQQMKECQDRILSLESNYENLIDAPELI